MIILEVGLEPHSVDKGDQRDPYTETEYWIKVNDGGKEWYVNREKSYGLNEALKKRDEMLDGIKGRRE